MINVVYEDNHVIVAVKPPNMLSQADKTKDADILSMVKDTSRSSTTSPAMCMWVWCTGWTGLWAA